MTSMFTVPPVAAPVTMTVNSVRLSPALEARLAATAARLGMSKSDLIRQSLLAYLDQLEPEAPVLAAAPFAPGSAAA